MSGPPATSFKHEKQKLHSDWKQPEFLKYIKWYDYAILGVVSAFCIVFFNPTEDLWHTGLSSMAYLKGHILDFYDYNLPRMGGNDYYPFLYVVFAIWNIPLRLSGADTIVLNSHYELTYEKLLPSLFMLLTSIPVYLIIRKLGKSVRTSMFGVFIFLTSAPMFVATICWGMYDTILVFFVTFGVYFFIREKCRWDMAVSMLLFGLSFATKPYALVIFIPLLAYRFKKLYAAAGYGFLSLVPYILCRLIYMKSKAFAGQAEDSTHFILRFFVVNIDNSCFKIPVYFLLFFLLTMVAYGIEYDVKNKIKALYILLPAAAIFYTFVLWHPQWITLIIPFLAITTAVSSKKAIYMALDIALGISYALHTIELWPQFDIALITSSFFSRFLKCSYSPFFLFKYFPTKYVGVYSSAVLAVLFANCILKNPFRNGSQYGNAVEISGKDRLYAYLRFIFGVGFYVGSMVLWFLMNIRH